ncbi:MAG: acyl-CoA dehydrogenase family protein [Marmoricola sp.]
MSATRSEEQDELARTVRSLLTKRASSAAVRAAMAAERGYDAALWQALVEQVGVAALAVPEEYDGFGASLVETGIVLEELGAALAPTPLLASSLAVARLLLEGDDDERHAQLPALAAGAVVPVDLGTVVLEPAEPVPAMDPTLRIAPGSGTALSPALLAVAEALVSALQVGGMQRALDMTVTYSTQREQFGRPIGSFQALKHRMADMLVLLEAGRSASRAAITEAAAYVAAPEDASLEDLVRVAAAARSWCTDAFAHLASETIQLHGGIAITWEHDAHLILKRAHALAALLRPAHRAREAVLIDS